MRFFNRKNFNVLEDIMGVQTFEYFIQHSGQILFSACMNGHISAIEWAAETLEKCGILQEQLNGFYNIWEGKKSTLLMFLCYMNMEDSEAVALLRKKGFSAKLLSFELYDRNALQTSIRYRNLKIVEELLKDPTWVKELLPNELHVTKALAALGSEPGDSKLSDYVKQRFDSVWSL